MVFARVHAYQDWIYMWNVIYSANSAHVCHQTCIRHGHCKVTHHVLWLDSSKNQVRPSFFFGWGILERIVQFFHSILCWTVHLAPDSFHNHNFLFGWILECNSFSRMDSYIKRNAMSRIKLRRQNKSAKSATHQFLSNHYVKFPHYEKPAHSLNHYTLNGLVSPYYWHQQLNALALLCLGCNNLRPYLPTWQQLLRQRQQQYNQQSSPLQLCWDGLP